MCCMELGENDASRLIKHLVSEIGLEPVQARVYLLVNCRGKMAPQRMASELGVPEESASEAAAALMGLGAFIDMPGGEFEAMHPRFTAVNMYRRRCEQDNVKFARNDTVDSIGVLLESHYDNARTK